MSEIPAGREATASGLAALRRFAAPPSHVRAAEAVEQCELCGEVLAPEHSHLVDLRERSITCACTACALLFDRPGARYRTVPDRVRIDPDAPLTEAEWTELAIPVSIAFFFANSDADRVIASYPSAAGVTECELDLAAWDRLADTHPLLREAQPDVEAILVIGGRAPGAAADAAGSADQDRADQDRADEDRAGQDRASEDEAAGNGTGAGNSGGIETFLVPIDVCYSMSGALRMDWHGFDGGPEVRKVLTDLLADLRRRARPLTPAPG
ncbi:MAG: hypothetical protein J2P26_03625 [Nocardiopsaceae bacterium]|nr:hypothetical protein [Nocardiopsaceae bacterium]